MYFLTCNYKFLNVHQTDIKKFLSQTQTIGIYVSHLAQVRTLYNCVLNNLWFNNILYAEVLPCHTLLVWDTLGPIRFWNSWVWIHWSTRGFPSWVCMLFLCVWVLLRYAGSLPQSKDMYAHALIVNTELAIMPGLHFAADIDTSSWRPDSWIAIPVIFFWIHSCWVVM